ncbi:MAG: CHAT domain-containing protein, partial [Cyanobacteriota bacterium]
IVHPVLLTGMKKVPDSVAIFILTKDKLTVTKKLINFTEFDNLVKDYRDQLQDRKNTDYPLTSAKLYDILIRPVEDQIQTESPTQLSIITSGKLRYIPFETLRDSQTGKYLIQKYPVNYLTRLSSRSWQIVETRNFTSLQNVAFLQGIVVTLIIGSLAVWARRKFGIVLSGVLVITLGGAIYFLLVGRNAHILALGNPVPTPLNLPGTEAEVNSITKIFPGSETYIGTQASLDTFKKQAPRFSFLHLATHGCFQRGGCPNLQMGENTLLFANKQQYNIADAALLGLKNTELITLSACQTAKEANANGEEIAGLAYIFERAGAKAVMASLWNAEDNATKEIMIQFYENIKKGMSKGEALRQAKLSQIDKDPFFWSPFVLIGDNR